MLRSVRWPAQPLGQAFPGAPPAWHSKFALGEGQLLPGVARDWAIITLVTRLRFRHILRVQVQQPQLQAIGFLDPLLSHPHAPADPAVPLTGERVLTLLTSGHSDMTPVSFSWTGHR